MMLYHLSASETVSWHRGERAAIQLQARYCAIMKGIRFCQLVSYAGINLIVIEVNR